MKFNQTKSAHSCLVVLSLAASLVSCAHMPAVGPDTAVAVKSAYPRSATEEHAAYNLVQKDGLTLVEISTKDPAGKELLGLTISPDTGSNIISLRYHGTEVLEQPKSLKDVYKQDAGIELLYPTPNRVKNSELTYKDLKLRFKPNLGAHFIHGLAREYAWSWSDPTIDGAKVSYKTWLNVDENSEFYKQFPIKNRVELTVVLEGEDVKFNFNVANLDQRSLPFGVGVHPYFVLHGNRGDSSVQIPVTGMMEAIDLLPTGKVIPLKKTKYAKLTKGMSVQAVLDADTVFYPTLTNQSSVVKEPGFRFEISASKDFGHTVLWAPPTRDLFAVENQTASTDAHNLANKGMLKESGLLELAPGAEWTGWVQYRFSNK